MYVSAPQSPGHNTGHVKIYPLESFEGMRKAGHVAAACLDMLVGEVREGVSTRRLDDLART